MSSYQHSTCVAWRHSPAPVNVYIGHVGCCTYKAEWAIIAMPIIRTCLSQRDQYTLKYGQGRWCDALHCNQMVKSLPVALLEIHIATTEQLGESRRRDPPLGQQNSLRNSISSFAPYLLVPDRETIGM